jgi:hypothetical protein
MGYAYIRINSLSLLFIDDNEEIVSLREIDLNRQHRRRSSSLDLSAKPSPFIH